MVTGIRLALGNQPGGGSHQQHGESKLSSHQILLQNKQQNKTYAQSCRNMVKAPTALGREFRPALVVEQSPVLFVEQSSCGALQRVCS